MHSFEKFVNSLQSAIVNSTEAINSRNKKILDDYFESEIREVIIENKNYNKDLFNIVQSIKNSELFKDYFKIYQIENSIEENSIEENISEDTVLAKLVKYVTDINLIELKNNDIDKYYTDNNILLTKYNFYNQSYFVSYKDTQIHIKSINDALKTKDDELLTKNNEFDNLKEQIQLTNDAESTEVADSKIIEQKNGLLSKLEIVTREIEDLQRIIQQLKADKLNKEEDLKNNELTISSYLNNLSLSLRSSKELLNLAKTIDKVKSYDKVKIDSIIKLILSSKRYIKKPIESLVPKTVRVNYPATFDYATPDNDKEFKTITTPVEVPLLTLVPITNYNIEKATFTANFKFGVDKEKVMLDFSKDTIEDGAQLTNVGKLEITLSPQQTPEGLKALIESYENFLKRQIV